ncbi:MAG: hypothetical protein EKE20_14795 [Candidatus Symbiopectobacterium sp. Dall1.0]|nr:hypothetical protein [Candidatus Symbiopectobacterium sp. Dall1.0]
MTKRIPFNEVWSSKAEKKYAAVDPDLDTSHPIFVKDKYQGVGWTTEKEPEQWQNFLQQITDIKLKDLFENGIVDWHSDVQYPYRSIVRYKEKLYLQLANGISIGEEPEKSGRWIEVSSYIADSFRAELKTLNKSISDHTTKVGASNPHDDDIVTIGGYVKKKIDELLSGQNEDLLAYHKTRKDNPHNVTPIQAGCLSAKDGGAFTGDITFLYGVALGNNATINKDEKNGDVGLSLGKIKLNLNNSGKAVVKRGGTSSHEILDDFNYNEKNIKINNLFAVPPPILEIPLSNTLCSVTNGRFTITPKSSVEVKIDFEHGLFISSSIDYYIDNLSQENALLTIHCSVGMEGKDGSILSKYVCADIKLIDNSLYALASKLVPDASYVKNIRIWNPPLTSEQKSMLRK